MPQIQPGQQIAVDLKNSKPAKCSKCKKDLFIPCFKLMKVSALMNPTGKDIMVPIQYWRCLSCNTVAKEFTPM